MTENINNLQKNDDDNLFIELYNEINKKIIKHQEISNKNLNEIRNDLKKLSKLYQKKKYTKKEREPIGISALTKVPNNFKNLLNLDERTLSRTEITKYIYDYIKNNNLQGSLNDKNKLDKRIYHVNDKLSIAFELTKEEIDYINSSKNSKDIHGLNFYNIQSWIKKIYDKQINDIN